MCKYIYMGGSVHTCRASLKSVGLYRGPGSTHTDDLKDQSLKNKQKEQNKKQNVDMIVLLILSFPYFNICTFIYIKHMENL